MKRKLHNKEKGQDTGALYKRVFLGVHINSSRRKIVTKIDTKNSKIEKTH